MAGIKVKVNGRSVGDLLKSDEVRAELTARADRVVAAAKSDAASYEVSGDFRNGIRVYQETTDRAAVRVGSDVFYALQVEAKHGTMARALDAAG